MGLVFYLHENVHRHWNDHKQFGKNAHYFSVDFLINLRKEVSKMTNSKKVISFIMSLVALAATPTFAGINASAIKGYDDGKSGAYPSVDVYFNNSADHDKTIECDINNDGNTDYYDVKLLEETVNRFGYDGNLAKNNKISVDSLISGTDTQEFEKTLSQVYGLLKYDRNDNCRSEDFYKKFDVNGDNFIDSNDIIKLLEFVQKDYHFVVNTGEFSAVLFGTNDNLKTEARLVVPAEIVYHKDGKSVILPVMEIDKDTFKNYHQLNKIEIPDYIQPFANHYYFSEDGKLSDKKLLDTNGKVAASTYLIIDDNAFANCENLANVSLPQNVRLSNKDVFSGSNNFLDQHLYKDTSNGAVVLYDHVDGVSGDESKYGDKTTAILMELGNSISYDGTLDIAGINADTRVYQDNYEKKITPVKVNVVNKLDQFVKDNNKAVTDIKDIKLPDDVYLEESVFSECVNCEKINGNEYIKLAENSAENKEVLDTVSRYISSFDGTPFILVVVDARANEIIKSFDLDENSTSFDKVKAVAKYIVKNIKYRQYNDTTANINDYFDSNDTIYPSINNEYNTSDQDRESIYKMSTPFFDKNTECGSFSFIGSVLLDKLGVENFSLDISYKKGYGHATVNYYNNETKRWYNLDLSILSGFTSTSDADIINVIDSIKFDEKTGKPSSDYVHNKKYDVINGLCGTAYRTVRNTTAGSKNSDVNLAVNSCFGYFTESSAKRQMTDKNSSVRVVGTEDYPKVMKVRLNNIGYNRITVDEIEKLFRLSDIVEIVNLHEVFHLGDVNFDMTFDSKDIDMINDYLAGNNEFSFLQKNLASIDYDNNNVINEADVDALENLCQKKLHAVQEDTGIRPESFKKYDIDGDSDLDEDDIDDLKMYINYYDTEEGVKQEETGLRPKSFNKYDIDANGILNSEDIYDLEAYISKYVLLGDEVYKIENFSDFNGDGYVDSNDVAILRAAFNS